MNQQLLIENKFLRENCDQQRASLYKLIEKNGALHKELKNITVHEILTEFEGVEQRKQNIPADIKQKEYCL